MSFDHIHIGHARAKLGDYSWYLRKKQRLNESRSSQYELVNSVIKVFVTHKCHTNRFSNEEYDCDFVRSNLYRSTCKENDKGDNCKISPNQGCCPSVQFNSNLCPYLHSPGHNLHKINQITLTYPKYLKRDSV